MCPFPGKISCTSNWQWSPCKNEGPSYLTTRSCKVLRPLEGTDGLGDCRSFFWGSWWTLKKYYEAFLGNLKTPVAPKGKNIMVHTTSIISCDIWSFEMFEFWDVLSIYEVNEKNRTWLPRKHLTKCGLEDYLPFWDTMCLKCLLNLLFWGGILYNFHGINTLMP